MQKLLRAEAVLHAQLEPTGPKANTIGGEPMESELVLHKDEFVEIGIWEVTPGTFLGIKDGVYEVMHHTQLLSKLVSEGRLKQADLDEGRRHDGLRTEERQEIVRLRRKVKQLELEREILSRAAAWLARETGSIPSRESSS